MSENLVVIRGGGDLGSGVALRLWRCGFRIVIVEREWPIAVRRTVSLSEAVYEDCVQVEELRGRITRTATEALQATNDGDAAVLVDPDFQSLTQLAPNIVVDAILAKRNLGTTRQMAPIVIALGPGFTAGRDVHAVVETNRGPHLGRVIWSGEAQRDTGEPGEVRGRSSSRVLRAPRDGILAGLRSIGDAVQEGESVALVGDTEVRAQFTGLLRGLARNGLAVSQGMKIGDVDPRMDVQLVHLVSDKSLAIAGGVLEAIMSSLRHNTP